MATVRKVTVNQTGGEEEETPRVFSLLGSDLLQIPSSHQQNQRQVTVQGTLLMHRRQHRAEQKRAGNGSGDQNQEKSNIMSTAFSQHNNISNSNYWIINLLC